MEGNKDEAERCIDIAEKCILEGKRDKAEKFLHKAEKLYSTQKAKGMRQPVIENVMLLCNLYMLVCNCRRQLALVAYLFIVVCTHYSV